MNNIGVAWMVIQTLIIVALIGCTMWSEKWRSRYRQLWIEMGRKWEVADIASKVASAKLENVIAERDEWTKTAWQANEANSQLGKVVASQRREITRQAEIIDALTNGDRACVNGHKYYTGTGITCPHCGAAEVIEPRCSCGQPATINDNGMMVCAACYIPF